MSGGRTRAGGGIVPPDYFQRVADNSRRRWDQLESDPELAGPWRQLFTQVQSPRHVVSELLQNADDAGATYASARLEGETFVFEHDGVDFDEATFGSLCRFGFSNKRTLHTIGFRGIGFKSTFSLGDSVSVTTPTLSFRFDRSRFTQPHWVADAAAIRTTRIAVDVSSVERKQEIQKNLEEWKQSSASLLFFQNITTLEVDGERVVRRSVGSGPFEGSQWIELGSAKAKRLLLIKSDDAEFPEDAIQEIRHERSTDEALSIPACRVEVVLGLPGDQRLYVVLPTGVRPPLPFSCNAPFIQDPARFGIKDPAISPTNRWLLNRIGHLAATAMQAWLGNNRLGIPSSVAAYDLLPDPPKFALEIPGDCAKRVANQFKAVLENECILVTADNMLVDKEDCVAPPLALYDVWTAPQLAEVCGAPQSHVLAREVGSSLRQRLVAWGWLSTLDDQTLLKRLASEAVPAHPGDYDKLLSLWQWAQAQHTWDYGGASRRTLRVVPVVGSDKLHAAEEVVRLTGGGDALHENDLEFLSSLIYGIERGWIDYLATSRSTAKGKSVPRDVQSALQMLTDIGLNAASSNDKTMDQAGERLAAMKTVTIEDAVRLAQIAAALDARLGPSFPFITRGSQLVTLEDGVVQDTGARVEMLVPPDWADEHLLHDQYISDFVSCTRQRWTEWSASDKSGLRPLVAISQTSRTTWNNREVDTFIRGRNSKVLNGYPFATGTFTITDHEFDPVLWMHWEELAVSDPDTWVKVIRLLAEDQTIDWKDCSRAQIRQKARVKQAVVGCDPIPAGWLVHLRRLKCLPDTYNVPRQPAELLMRTPDTEPLLGVEPFVSAELDRPATRDFLSLLGVRDTPAGAEKLLSRIRDLAAVLPVPVQEVARWYGALDRLVARSGAEQVDAIRNFFADDDIVLTHEEAWATSGEVFRSSGEDLIPGLALLHPAVADLPLWRVLGVADEPDDDLIVEWVKKLPTGASIEIGERSRLRAFLTRCPNRIWNEASHWLSLDGTWTSTGNLRFHIARRPDARITALFPRFKAIIAELSMVRRETQHPALTATTELSEVIEYRVSDHTRPDPADGEARPWLLALGQSLSRLKVTGDENVGRVIEAGRRLARTVLHYKPNLSVIPYIEHAPAGEQVFVRALWSGNSLLIADQSPARYTEPLIDELSRVFSVPRIADAIRVCIDRQASYIEAYLTENFELGPVEIKQRQPEPQTQSYGEDVRSSEELASESQLAEDAHGDADVGTVLAPPPPQYRAERDHHERAAGGMTDDCGEAADEPEQNELSGTSGSDDNHSEHHSSYVNSRTDSEPRIISVTRLLRSNSAPREPGGPTFVNRFAHSRNFAWNSSVAQYSRDDGHSIAPTSGPFQWEWRDHRGVAVCHLWVAEQTLEKGVEMDTYVWEAIKASPTTSSVIVIGDDGQPTAVLGNALLKMVDAEEVIVYPATYRLRRPPR